MSDTYRPQPWLTPYPDQAGPQGPLGLQVDTHVPSDASQSDKGVLMAAAHQIVQGNGAQLDRFVANNRQQIGQNQQGYYERRTDMQGMTARYTWNNGREKLRLDVYPTGGEQQVATATDINLDGYISWIHGEPCYPLEVVDGVMLKSGPFMLAMNGCVLTKSFQPRLYFGNSNCSMYTVMFGKTALLCASAVDKDHKNPLLSNSALKKPFPMIPDFSGSIDAGTECDGTYQDKRPETFGYWIFDWENDWNPCSFIKRMESLAGPKGFRWSNPGTPPDAHGGGDTGWMSNLPYPGILADPTDAGGIYFPDVAAGKSPLKPFGRNVIGSYLGAGADFSDSLATSVEVFIAEFYDRGKYSIVSQSWSVPARARQTIAATTKPRLYSAMALNNSEYPGTGLNLSFDLDPKATKNGDGEGAMGPHDFFTVTGMDQTYPGYGDALTPEQKAAVDAWLADNRDQMNAFLADQAKKDSDLHDQLVKLADDVRIAHDYAWWLRANAGDARKYTTGIYKNWLGDVELFYTQQEKVTPQTDPATAQLVPIDGISGLLGVQVTLVAWTASASGLWNASVEAWQNQNYYIVVPHRPDYKDPKAPLPYDSITDIYDANMGVEAAHGTLGSMTNPQYTQDQESDDYTSGARSYNSRWTIRDHGPPPASFHSDITGEDYDNKILGPYVNDLSGAFADMDDFLVTTMQNDDDIVTQIAANLKRKPPDYTPFPGTVGDANQYKYSEFGPGWDFDQNP